VSQAESRPRRDLNPRYRRERASDEVRPALLNLARASNHASLKGFYHCLTLPHLGLVFHAMHCRRATGKGFEGIGRKSGSFGLWESRPSRTGSSGGRWRHRALKRRLDVPFRGGRVYVIGRPEIETGNPG